MKLLNIHMENFKCWKDKTVEFGQETSIYGMNGAGKSTVSDAHYWLFSDKDYSLKSNPNIRTIGSEELQPRVAETWEINGATVTIAKTQKRTVGKPDANGISKITLTNSYEINDVPKTERDFRKDLTEKGFDFDLLLPLSHPDVFTGQKAVDMRKVLFNMSTSRTDQEVAELTAGCGDVAALLQSYKAEEIEAMNKASKKKADEQIDAIPNQIIGLEKAKVDIDTAELELQRNGLKEMISELDSKINDSMAKVKEFDQMSTGIMDLKFEQSDIVRKANEQLVIEKKLHNAKLAELESTKWDLEQSVRTLKTNKQHEEKQLSSSEDYRKKLLADWQTEHDREFDENSLVCQYCGQLLPQDKQEELKQRFETGVADSISRIEAAGMDVAKGIEGSKKKIKSYDTKIAELSEQIATLFAQISEKQDEISKLPDSVDLTDNQEYQRICAEISKSEEYLKSFNDGSDYRETLKAEQEERRQELSAVEAEIAKSLNNVRIDEQIEELKAKKMDYEQKKADAEKILYQLSLVSKAKNNLMVEEINSHFDIVKWKLFEFLKNGSYSEVCVPMVDGYEFGTSTNTGREVLAKLDIIKGLQRFYGQHYPVFLDGAECLSDDTMKRIDMDCQMIYLNVKSPVYAPVTYRDENGVEHEETDKDGNVTMACIYDGILTVEVLSNGRLSGSL